MVPDKPQAGTTSRPKLAVATLGTLLVGLILTYVAYSRIAEAARDRLEQRFAAVARAYTESLRVTLQSYIEKVDEVGENAEGLASTDYHQLHGTVDAAPDEHPGLVLLGFAPWVPRAARQSYEDSVRIATGAQYAVRERRADRSLLAAAARPDHFPLRSLFFTADHASINGLDLASDRIVLAAIEQARDNAKITISAPTTLIEPAKQECVLLFPVYRGGGRPKTVEERQGRLRGFAVGVIRVESIAESALTDDAAALAVTLTDRLSNTRLASMNVDATAPRDARFYRGRFLDFAGRSWLLETTPTQSFLRANASNEPKLVLLIGLGVTALLGIAAASTGRAYVRVARLASHQGEALADAQVRQATILNHMAEALLVVDIQGVIQQINPATSRLFGWSADELIGQEIGVLVPTAFRARHHEWLRNFDAGDGTLSRILGAGRQLFGVHRNGTEIPIQVNVTRLPHRDGDHFIAVVRNMVEERRVQRAMRLVVEGAAGTAGSSTFDAITRSLSGALGVRCVLIAELKGVLQAQTLSLWEAGRHVDPMEYDLRGTPCERVVGREPCLFSDRVQDLYPADRALALLGARSYLGQPIFGADGTLLGVLAIIDDKPLEDASLAQSLLGLLGPRVAAEIERLRADQELRQSGERLALAVEGSKLALWDLNLVTGEVFLSARWGELTGAGGGAGLATIDQLFASVHPDDRDLVNQAFRAAITGKSEFYDAGHRVLRADGTCIWVRSHGKVTQRDADGRALRMVGTNADVTWEKQATLDLAARELELRSVCDHIPANIARFDRNLRYRYVNARKAAMRKRGAESMVGLHVADVIGEDNYCKFAVHYERALAGEVAHYDICDQSSGKPLWLDVTLFPDFDAQGVVQGCFLASWDVTERVLAEQALHASKLLLERTVAHLPVGVSVMDAALNVVAFNETFLALLDFPPQRFELGDPLEKFLRYNAERGEYGPGDVDEQVANRLELAKRFKAHQFERTRPDGTVIEVRGMAVPGGGYVTLYSDVTARKQFEYNLVRAREQAEATARAKSEFLATMSHEIRTPMNGVLGMTEILLSTELDQEQRGYADTILRSGQGLLTILNDILDLSKVEAGKLVLEAIPFDVVELLADVKKLQTAKSAQKGLALAVAVEPGCPQLVNGDPGRIRQVLNNLVGNAIKFTEQGRVDVRVTCLQRDTAQTMLHFSIEDTGIGVDPQAREGLFQPFVQADASMTRRFGGTGLGLSICKRLVELMGGRIGFEPGREGGSRFWFHVPLAAAEPHFDSAAPESVGRLPQGTPRRVLLAEDNATTRKFTTALLRRCGCDVVEAHDGAQALERFAQGDFDLVLMDMHMPVMDGVQATRAIRDLKSDDGKRVPVVALTANASPEARSICEAAGMDDFLPKPFLRGQLIAVLDRWLGTRAANAESAEPVTFGQDTGQTGALDPTRLEVLRAEMGDEFPVLAAAYVRESAELVEAMHAAWRQGDIPGLGQYAHALKSSSANMGATELTSLAERMERAAGVHVPDDAESLLAAMEEQVRRASVALEDYCNQSSQQKKAA